MSNNESSITKDVVALVVATGVSANDHEFTVPRLDGCTRPFFDLDMSRFEGNYCHCIDNGNASVFHRVSAPGISTAASRHAEK